MTTTTNGVMAIAGYWDPLASYRRRGGWFGHDESRHAEYHSAATVAKLEALGVTTVIWHGYRGFGIQHERPEWERLKPFRRFLERAGIEFGVYLQCGTYFAETFYEENPHAREWTALDYWGKPQTYSEFYRTYYRHRPCLTHRAFSEYVARAAEILVREYGVRFLSCDNNAQMPCYTPRFEQAFRQFLKDKYATHTAEGLARFVRRYGHPHVANIVLPHGSARRPLEALPALTDPGLQDWVEFRCRLLAQHSQIITTAAKAADPATRLCYNLAYDYGEFHQLAWGTEPEWIAPHADFLFSEDDNWPRVTEDGRLISHVHTCRHLRALGRRGQFHPPRFVNDPATRAAATLSLLELAIHNQGSLGAVYYADFDPAPGDPRPAAIRFIREHADIFTDNSTVAEIAVLRSQHSSTINWLEATEGRRLAQQALFQAGFQWDNVIESTLDQLARYRLLVLPETVSVPDDCVAQIAEYVRHGGRVLAVGAALSCDAWGRLRPLNATQTIQGERNADYGATYDQAHERAILAAWLGIEGTAQNRLFVFPRLRHPRPHIWDPDDPRAPVLGSGYHARPLNEAEFLAAVRQALPAPPLVEISAGPRLPHVIPTLLRANRTRAVSLHLLNYQAAQPIEPLTVRLALPELRSLPAATLIRLDSTGRQTIPIAKIPTGITVALPVGQQYLGALFEPTETR